MAQRKHAERLPYIPARLAEKRDRWEIVYYQTDPATGIRARHRETGDLNRVRDMKERRRQAAVLVARINKLLPDGYPYNSEEQIARRNNTLTLRDAVEMAVAIKCKTDKVETWKDYKSIGGVFLQWVDARKIGQWPVTEFTRRQAIEFMDYVATRPGRDGVAMSNRTWNNYKIKISTIFGELVRREHIPESPFRGIQKKPVFGKSRRKCTAEERALIAAWLWQHNYFTFLFITLEYYCLLRGTELRRLRAGDFDLQRGVILLAASKSKTNRERYPTMPAFVREILRDTRFTRIPTNYFVFGEGGQPHPRRAWGRGYARYHLSKCLEALQAEGRLGDVSGISPYSFKDTGITEWLRLLPLVDVMQQAGHTSPATTMIYNQPDLVNRGFQEIKKNIFE